MKIYFAGNASVLKKHIPDHPFYRKKKEERRKKILRLLSYFEISNDLFCTNEELKIIKEQNEKPRLRTSSRT